MSKLDRQTSKLLQIMLFKQGLVLHNYIINLHQNMPSTLFLVFKLCYIVPPPKARNLIFIISNLSKIQFVATKCNGFLQCTPKNNVTVKNYCSRWAKKTQASPSCYVTQSLSESLQQATLSFSKNQSSKHTFFKQILDPLVFSFTSFIFKSVVTRVDSRVTKILQPLTGFHVML